MNNQIDLRDEILEYLQHCEAPATVAEIQAALACPSSVAVYSSLRELEDLCQIEVCHFGEQTHWQACWEME